MTSVSWPGNQDVWTESSGTWQRLSLILPTWTERMDSPWVCTFPSHRITTKHEIGVYLHTGMKQIYLTLWPLCQSLWEKKVISMKLKHGLIHRPILIFYFPQTLNLNRMDNCYYYGTFNLLWLTPEWYAKFLGVWMLKCKWLNSNLITSVISCIKAKQCTEDVKHWYLKRRYAYYNSILTAILLSS